MREYGIVLELSDNNAIIGIERNSACSKCGACEPDSGHFQMKVSLKNTMNAKPGDIVELQLSPIKFLKASVILYLIPLLALIFGVALGYGVGIYLEINREFCGIICGILLTFLAYLLIKMKEPKFKKDIDLTPQIIGVYSDEKGECLYGK